jgi:23S rRNA (pseudouridine1915-N3)-methyltransferase
LDLHVLAVGRCREPALAGLVEEYRRRCRPWTVSLREVADRRALPPARQPDAEAALLLEAVPGGAVLVALDGRGEDLTSEAFAARLGRWRDGGERAVAFAIGGPEGLGDAIVGRAALRLALGRMTWPHLLVRVMLTEQLYRATTILAGHPYHRA